MALFKIDLWVESLKRIVDFHMYLPNDGQLEFSENNPHYKRETKTLYLLHGYSGNSTDWVTGSSAMEMSRKYNLAIVMPSGENSFYINRKGIGNSYESYIVDDLFNYISKTFNLSSKKEDVIIGGLSMGGFGALRLGIKYGEKYSALFGLSSALIIEKIKGMKEGETDFLSDYYYYNSIFGNLDTIDESDMNPKYILKNKLSQNAPLPRIFLACGTEDYLIDESRQFRDFLTENKVGVKYFESKGMHNWDFWNEYLEPAIVWAINNKAE